MLVFIGKGGTLIHSCPYFGSVFCGVLTRVVWLSHNPTSMQLPSLKGKALRVQQHRVLLLHRFGCNQAKRS